MPVFVFPTRFLGTMLLFPTLTPPGPARNGNSRNCCLYACTGRRPMFCSYQHWPLGGSRVLGKASVAGSRPSTTEDEGNVICNI